MHENSRLQVLLYCGGGDRDGGDCDALESLELYSVLLCL